MRAVSFFGPGEVAGEMGSGFAMAAEPDALTAAMGRGGGAGTLAGFGINGGDAGAGAGADAVGRGAGGIKVGAEIGLDGAGGNGDFAIGGREAGVPVVGVIGAGADALGGRAGKLIRTVSRLGLVPPPEGAGRGGKVMRTVSFFGSFESAMNVPNPQKF